MDNLISREILCKSDVLNTVRYSFNDSSSIELKEADFEDNYEAYAKICFGKEGRRYEALYRSGSEDTAAELLFVKCDNSSIGYRSTPIKPCIDISYQSSAENALAERNCSENVITDDNILILPAFVPFHALEARLENRKQAQNPVDSTKRLEPYFDLYYRN